MTASIHPSDLVQQDSHLPGRRGRSYGTNNDTRGCRIVDALIFVLMGVAP